MNPCPNGTAASYAGNSYRLGNPNIVLTFPQNFYTCTGDLTISPDQFLIQLDPKGPASLLLNTLGKWNLTQPNKQVQLQLNFKISGSTASQGWQHGATITQDATVMTSTIIYTNPMVRSDSYLYPTSEADKGAAARYDTSPHQTQALISLTSNHSTCTLITYGLHFG